MKYFFLLLLIPSLTAMAHDITTTWDKNGIVKKRPDIDFDKRKKDLYISPEKRGDRKGIVMNFNSDDSVSVYLNDSLIFSQWIKLSEMNYISFFPHIFPVMNRKNNTVSILLNSKKEYISFKMKKNYYMAKVYYLCDSLTDCSWVILFDNNLPSE